jgi:hypothetical protein
MATGQAAFLELGDGFGTTFARWQSYWIDAITSWDGQSWTYQQLDWAGVTSGQATGEQATLTLPAVPSVLAMTETALAGPWVVTLRVIQFDEAAASATAPPAEYVLAASCVGEVIDASASLTQMAWILGSALSPIGAQFPPTTALTALIGVPCRL